MSSDSRYTPSLIEHKWYSHWQHKDYFSSVPDDREAYAIVIPPPNVTGMLHMGHMLNNTIQDILIRKARMEGKNACWVPGTDHASIATEAKVVRWLREEKGLKKSDLTRPEFLEYAWQWKEKYGGIILEQLKKLGASCDWKRTAFTMDEVRSKAVIKVFVDLYKKDKLYRGLRMVNWDPSAKTVLSNEEVLFSDEQSNLYHVRYRIDGTEDEWITIATTRPETILADTAVAVHPDDERYAHLVGKMAIIPMVNRVVPIIFDTYVEKDFGTGALKVTPAHDVNDYELGLKHGLEVIDIFEEDGTLTPAAQFYVGLDRFEVRKRISKDLDKSGHLLKMEPYQNSVGRSERTNAVVEPRLSLQWYVRMQSLTEPALKAVIEDDIRFFPKQFKNTYRHWMENFRDWCISRQLWWGHQIPAWYLGEEVFVGETVEEALTEAIKSTGNTKLLISDLRQDEDVLDTWFSSWLWPISVFDGFESKEEIDYYYPTAVVVTGWDIIFLWIARMVMAGYEWRGDKPFRDVYFTGMVRDKLRRKMSKQLGNSPDPLKLIEDFGADGVRFGMLASSPAGGDLLFDDKLCEQGRNFCNKMWNALRLLKGLNIVDEEQSPKSALASAWLTQRMDKVLEASIGDFEQYRLSEVLMNFYKFVWDDFCSWYLEMIKPAFGEAIDRKSYEEAVGHFERICSMLHPFMPFITEELWHSMRDRAEGEDCMISIYPKAQSQASELLGPMEQITDIISKIRDARNKNGIGMKLDLELLLEESANTKVLLALDGASEMLVKLANLKQVVVVKEEPAIQYVSFVSGTDKIYLEMPVEIDKDSEEARLSKELEYANGFLKSIQQKLSNEKFVNSAPEAVVDAERRKMADGEARVRLIQESLNKLKA
ncbi:MAG: valine--tRNA ligase [Saprospiraceae bacterium]